MLHPLYLDSLPASWTFRLLHTLHTAAVRIATLYSDHGILAVRCITVQVHKLRKIQ